jgi:hypothetical protein
LRLGVLALLQENLKTRRREDARQHKNYKEARLMAILGSRELLVCGPLSKSLSALRLCVEHTIIGYIPRRIARFPAITLTKSGTGLESRW